ncbi:MAG: hypothetical protein E6772_03365 [Dysgonomonas sp.]|nr:hypothetical protein [Dysgonomonas sp.]
MDIQYRHITGILFITLSLSVQAQSVSSSLKSSLKDDIRKDLLKQVKPPQAIPGSSMRPHISSQKAIRNESLEELSKKYITGTGGSEFDDKYHINPHVTTYSSPIPVNKAPDGFVVPMFIGGHWVFASPVTRVDGLIVPSGLDLSGGGKKKMSAKAKSILENVFGMEVEE